MNRRLLQVFGLVVLIGMFAGSVTALLMVKERFRISIAGETSEAKAGPDPLALVQDDVAALRRDLSALSQALGRNFETLAAGDEGAEAARRQALEQLAQNLRQDLAGATAGFAQARSADQATADARQRALLAELAQLAQRLDALSAEQRELAARPLPGSLPTPLPTPLPMPFPAGAPASVPPAEAALAPPTPAASTGPGAPASPEAAPPAAPASAPAAATPPGSGAPAPRRKPFLSFALPSEGLDLNQALRFEVLPALSRVGFDAKSTLHDFSGVTSRVAGTFTARLSAPGAGTTGQVRAEAAGLDTGIEERNQEMRSTLEAAKFPSITFEILSFTATESDPKTRASKGTAHGRLTLHGVTKELDVPLKISVDESQRAVISGEAPLRMTDYGVTPPKKMGVISVENQVRIWLELRARAVGRAE